ncbi:MAG TPA: hypothetical protein VF980_11565 [Thermoanaerobaculia bacterium]
MTAPSHFAIVTRDELWSLDRHTVLESRLIHGSAEQHGNRIDARDDSDDELRRLCDAECDRLREALKGLREGRARAVASATRVGGNVTTTSTISATVLDLSVATTLPHLAPDYEMLVDLASVKPTVDTDYARLPVVWRNGSGAVLLHEAAGHAAEHGHAQLAWPRWLSATDESEDGASNLLAGEAPRALRRQSFADVPLRRMTNVVIGSDSDSPLPDSRIEVLLVAGGRYEPLSGMVSLFVSAADEIDGGKSSRVRPFMILESRASIAAAMRGALGPVRRYPGVICSREGQELFVGSYAPDLITDFR